MRKHAITLSAGALVLGLSALSAGAQTSAARLNTLLQNATPIITRAACPGDARDQCPRGRYWLCRKGRGTEFCSCSGTC